MGREKCALLFKLFRWESGRFLVAKILEDIGLVIELVSKKPSSIHSIVCTTGIHKRTVKRYLMLIEIIQAAPKLKKEIKGARVIFRMDV